MDKLSYMGKLMKAVDAAIQEHKNAQTKDDYIYTMGKIDALKQVVEWLKE